MPVAVMAGPEDRTRESRGLCTAWVLFSAPLACPCFSLRGINANPYDHITIRPVEVDKHSPICLCCKPGCMLICGHASEGGCVCCSLGPRSIRQGIQHGPENCTSGNHYEQCQHQRQDEGLTGLGLLHIESLRSNVYTGEAREGPASHFW
jgi:hypothetical protein